ncbi:MAG: hypothetical protein NTX95_02525 [Actinobacteria bacterium]|nr:hypothetical protein [Actinomycetota bacterium]
MSALEMEIWFPSQQEVTVFLGSSFVDRDERDVAYLSLFSYFAARTSANLGGSPAKRMLGAHLMNISSQGEPAARFPLAENDVALCPPTTRGGRKGFTSTLKPDKRKFFTYKLHGFGMLGKGSEFYAPMAVFAFAAHLFDRHGEDQTFTTALRQVASGVGSATVTDQLGIINQHDVAMAALAVALSN